MAKGLRKSSGDGCGTLWLSPCSPLPTELGQPACSITDSSVAKGQCELLALALEDVPNFVFLSKTGKHWHCGAALWGRGGAPLESL